MKKIILSSLAGLLVLALFACGTDDATTSTSSSSSGSTSSSGASALTDDQQSQTTTMLEQSMSTMSLGITTLSASQNANLTKFVATDCSSALCTSGGTCAISYNSGSYSLSYGSCVSAHGTFDGSLDVTTSSSTSFTLTADEFSYTDTEGNSFVTDGSITASLSADSATIAFDSYSGTINVDNEETTLTFDGDLTYDLTNDVIDGTLTITYAGDVSATVTCTFTDFPATDPTDTDIENACGF